MSGARLFRRAGTRARAVIRSPLTWGLLAHAATRWLFYQEGVRFDDSSLAWFWQFADPAALRTDFARTILHLHAQPPLFNAFLGGVLHLAPEHTHEAFWATYLAFGALLHVSLYALIRRAGVGPLSAAIAALLFTASPAAILYESWLFYTYPLTACLCAAAAMSYRYVARRRVRDGLIFFSLIATVALTRSLFHLVWCAAVLGLVLLAVPRRDRFRTIAVAAAPLLLVVALYAKNAVLFRQFGSSTWLGMNLARLTLHHAPPLERHELIRDGTLTALARIPPFSPLERYPDELSEIAVPPIPVLSQRVKVYGIPNFNHLAYVGISRAYLRDSLAMIRARPGIYLHNVAIAFGIYALPATEYGFVELNRRAIRDWDRKWRLVPGGALGILRDPNDRAEYDRYDPRWLLENAAWAWALLFFVALAVSTRRGLRTLRGSGPRPRAAMLLFVALCIGYVTLLGNLFEIGENNRFRFMIDPMIWAVAWATAAALCRRLLRRLGAHA